MLDSIGIFRQLARAYMCLVAMFASLACAQSELQRPMSNEPDADEALQLIEKTVGLTVFEQSFFADRIASAMVYFDTVVAPPDYSSRESDSCSVFDIEVLETPDSAKGKSVAMFRFLPKRVGVVELPSLEFRSESVSYRTSLHQIRVKEPIRSANMTLSLQPVKRQAYVGEPLRVDLSWDCSLNAAALQALRLYPEFFSDKRIEIVIPRNQDAKNQQVGLPIGGRRVIASRTKSVVDPKHLGRITLPLYLRFTEPGTYVLSDTRLECALLADPERDFGRYAAHFNNGLFEAVDSSKVYDRIYTIAPEVEIEVLPLPVEQQDATFSGLFAPLKVDVSVTPTEVKIGELVDLEIKLTSSAPHGMLALPPLNQQVNLRERVLVDGNYQRIWHDQGTSFRTRFRILSTTFQSFPSLNLQIFDPQLGTFQRYLTEVIPLDVRPSDGMEYLSLKSFEGAAVTLTNQPEGIWHNMEANVMNDVLNALYGMVRAGFWPLLAFGPLAFFLLRPWMRERRRRAIDERYRHRAEAYAAFLQEPAESRQKWRAFLRFMAVTFDASDLSWTRSDSEHALHQIGAKPADVERLTAMHNAADAEEFSSQARQAQFKDLDALAKRIMRLAAKGVVSVCWLAMLLPVLSTADEWDEAERLFAQALAIEAGSERSNALYQDAALKFQVASSTGRAADAWYNAGNAWFQSGEIGRAIAAYRQAALCRPFDQNVADNLKTARAMRLNDVPQAQSWWERLPVNWLRAIVVLLNLLFWFGLLVLVRYRHRYLTMALVVCASGLFIVSIYLIHEVVFGEQGGVVIVDSVYGKKGPSYAYSNAFNEMLHDGVEFELVEQRDDWALIQLADARRCWLPLSQLQLIVE